jgi:hypothetical protein
MKLTTRNLDRPLAMWVGAKDRSRDLRSAATHQASESNDLTGAHVETDILKVGRTTEPMQREDCSSPAWACGLVGKAEVARTAKHR